MPFKSFHINFKYMVILRLFTALFDFKTNSFQAMVSAQEVNKRTMIRTAAPKVHVQEAGKSRESIEITAKSTDQVNLLRCS